MNLMEPGGWFGEYVAPAVSELGILPYREREELLD
jgi:hypothetical protein